MGKADLKTETLTAADETAPPDSEELIARARKLQPLLREEQQACEERGHPSRDVAKAIRDAGLFRILSPKRYGGYQMALPNFYAVIMEIARGCPSTGWWYALGAAHAVQVSSYLEKQGQDEVFAHGPDFCAPWSFNADRATALPVAGGYRVSGKWAYCSGAPHADFFMGGMSVPDMQGRTASRETSWIAPTLTVVVPRGQFEMLDDWGDFLGMRGSGSNSVVLQDVFVPDHMTIRMNHAATLFGETPGSRLHDGAALYGGLFNAFAEGSLAAMAAGTAMAAIDEYIQIMKTRTAGFSGRRRIDIEDYQRTLGLAIVMADTARAAAIRGAEIYMETSARSVADIAPFTNEAGVRLDGMYHMIEKLVAEVVESLLRTASSAASRNGQKLQRYWRDVTTLRSRRDQLDFRAAGIALEYLKAAGHLSSG
ncbi:acyl-CoA dehydrogenase family protein [Mesorhizobium sp. SP-1A]|uniref:acyl-CoA dehydrogenase family protein n=1 Tax=Mesorhizobium sp. SP-1A TaxID=3077840 RepID=UPI0028F6EF93|nr:acyl-CoA dehydrogenase family protein [Mesorhizobium sp. SP-1A]